MVGRLGILGALFVVKHGFARIGEAVDRFIQSGAPTKHTSAESLLSQIPKYRHFVVMLRVVQKDPKASQEVVDWIAANIDCLADSLESSLSVRDAAKPRPPEVRL